MSTSVSRRTVLAGGAGTAIGLALPGAAHAHGHRPTSVSFTLDATTLDGGEQVTSVTLDTARLGPIDPAGLHPGTFTVHAKATSPVPIAPGDLIFSEYDLDRTVTAARLDRHGNIVLELRHAEGQLGGGTLGYILSRARNVRLDLVYTITQNAPLVRRHGPPLTITSFVQGQLSNPEVDAFSHHVSGSGMKYRLYSPQRPPRHGRLPLILWLHGAGEGASLPDDYYDNETTLRANRGALGFATPQAQRIFSDAYVVAPQSTSYWMEDGPRFAPLIREIVDDLVRRRRVDPDRIYVAGCSNGGYMALKMTVAYPDLFAASVPVCGVVEPLGAAGPPLITDAELAMIQTPTWLVTSRDDDTVPPETNTVHAHHLIPGSLVTLYDHVVWNGYQFPGHFSWIYLARNDPSIGGTHIWQWMARRRR
ncbi:prolyl oligopeptidase family serine peptidase [Micromonospora antibiotica]|uniref:Prolyl oligopeptidase family serine peptidase n=1 Tax=Micromonospora antibiotica TaxID=2807623 RepID=A0ABS3V8L0_9ACTN|nr:PHB depolymerase family esterase [Micromonospora antibiotica]MBO4161951.1 prolyl oligopeptidase family serine peptidase [Micromonospora antibiotica]